MEFHMQARTARRYGIGQIRRVALAVGLLGCLVIGAAALTVADQLRANGGSESRSVTVPYPTSDEAWSMEASLLATATAHQHSLTMQSTSDEVWQLEQNLLLEQNSWGEHFDLSPATAPCFPSPDDASLTHNGIPSY